MGGGGLIRISTLLYTVQPFYTSSAELVLNEGSLKKYTKSDNMGHRKLAAPHTCVREYTVSRGQMKERWRLHSSVCIGIYSSNLYIYVHLFSHFTWVYSESCADIAACCTASLNKDAFIWKKHRWWQRIILWAIQLRAANMLGGYEWRRVCMGVPKEVKKGFLQHL